MSKLLSSRAMKCYFLLRRKGKKGFQAKQKVFVCFSNEKVVFENLGISVISVNLHVLLAQPFLVTKEKNLESSNQILKIENLKFLKNFKIQTNRPIWPFLKFQNSDFYNRFLEFHI